VSRVLALDHGLARCGVAVCDPTGTIVSPLQAVNKPDTKPGLASLAALCSELQVERVVVGLPLSMDGTESEQTVAARKFAQRLGSRVGDLPIELFDERLTTAEARARGGAASEDSRAAAVLLERWLESGIRSSA